MSLSTSLREFAYPKKDTVDARFYTHPIALGYQELDRYLDNIFYRYRVYEQVGAHHISPFVKMAKYIHLVEEWNIRAEILAKVAQTAWNINKTNGFKGAATAYMRGEEGIINIFKKHGCKVEVDEQR